jgi:cobalt-zinc-cadmium efflux system protein
MSNHEHGDLRLQSKSRLLLVLALTGAYMLVEVAVGLYSGSLALLADAGHMLSDVAALVFALLAIWFASRKANPVKSYGYYRSEILAGLINGVILTGVSLGILWEAYRRFNSPPEVLGTPVLVVAVIGLVINIVSAKLLSKSAAHSLNVKAAYMEVIADLLATIGVIISSVIIMFSNWYMADPIVSGLIGLMILPRTWMLLTECTNILMEGAPGHIDLGQLRQAMLKVPGVVDVHDIHVWTITSGMDAMSGHVTIDAASIPDQVLSQITDIAQHDFELHHTTIQVEQLECKNPDVCQP